MVLWEMHNNTGNEGHHLYYLQQWAQHLIFKTVFKDWKANMAHVTTVTWNSLFENRSHICFSVIWNNIRSPVSWSHLVNWSLIYIHLLQKDLCPEVYYAYWLERVKYKQQGKERKRKKTQTGDSLYLRDPYQDLLRILDNQHMIKGWQSALVHKGGCC